ncbi:MAG: WYL domain-containing protein [Actinomycetaceae bacterium]|nr:WYL domain-containing protein [Actinomycetaceae bacterium]
MPERIFAMEVIEVLKKHTTPDEPMNIAQLRKAYTSDYDTKRAPQRQTWATTLGLLADKYCPDNVKFTEKTIGTREVRDSWYWTEPATSQVLSPAEVALLTEPLKTHQALSPGERQELVKILSAFCEGEIPAHPRNTGGGTENQNYINNIKMIFEAIKNGLRLSFRLGVYSLATGRIESDSERRQSDSETIESNGKLYADFKPLGLVSVQGHLYMVGTFGERKKTYQVHCVFITDIKIMDGGTEEKTEIFSSEAYAEEHPFMWSNPERCVFRFVNSPKNRNRIFLDFGRAFMAPGSKAPDEPAFVVNANVEAMTQWALSVGSEFWAIEPESLRKKIASRAKEIAKKYSEETE